MGAVVHIDFRQTPLAKAVGKSKPFLHRRQSPEGSHDVVWRGLSALAPTPYRGPIDSKSISHLILCKPGAPEQLTDGPATLSVPAQIWLLCRPLFFDAN